MLGDRQRCYEADKNVRCQTALLGTGKRYKMLKAVRALLLTTSGH
jgi:hypothetical protein